MNTRPPSGDCLWRAVTLPAVPKAVADGRAWSKEIMKEWQLDDIGGRGLTIVEALSDRWGVHITGYTKTVWCEVIAWRG